MTDSEVLSQAAQPWTPADPWMLAGRELGSRLILGTGGVPSLDVLRQVARRLRRRTGHGGHAARRAGRERSGHPARHLACRPG